MSRVQTSLIFFLFLCCLTVPARALEILALPTVMDQEMDAWHYIPSASEPAIYPTGQVYRGQPFRLLVMARDYDLDSLQNANITYTVQVFTPDGSPAFKQQQQLELFKGPARSDAHLLLSQQFLTLDFSATDPYGLYRFEITALDLLGRQSATTTTETTLAPFTTDSHFASKQEFSDWLINYYRAPDPARAVAALLQFIEPVASKDQAQTPLLIFFSRVITDSPFLWPHLKAVYMNANAADRKKILLFGALCGQDDDSFFSTLTPEMRSFYTEAGTLRLPEEIVRPSSRHDIDNLWAEFAATGKIDPIRSLVAALDLEPPLDSGEQLMPTAPEEIPAPDDVFRTTLGSLLVNGEHHSLVKQYLGYIYEFENPGPLIKARLEEILGYLQKRENEETGRKYLEEQRDKSRQDPNTNEPSG